AAPAEAVHGAAEQPRVFRLFREPKVNDGAHLGALAPEPFRVIGNERSGTAAIAKPELLQRTDQRTKGRLRNGHRRRPIRFGAVETVPFKVSDPFCVVHWSD